MRQAAWLFVRGSESIWIERLFGQSMVVAGPGAHHEQRDFIDDAALNLFQISLAERLAGDGWLLWPPDEDRRSGHDRRGARRDVTDRRRRPAQAAVS